MRSLKKLLIVLLLLGMGGAVAFLLSQLNARHHSVQVVNGSLIVMKGRIFPIGSEPFRPVDPAMRDAYAPIPLDGSSPGNLPEARFTERDELDGALFEGVGRGCEAGPSGAEGGSSPPAAGGTRRACGAKKGGKAGRRCAPKLPITSPARS